MDELDVELQDGTILELMFKNLSWQALLEDARHAKPAFLHHPLREIEVYRTVLKPHHLGTATCYGALVNEERGHYWLFLERVAGLRLSHVGEFATWQEVARYLGRLHNCLARQVNVLGQDQPVQWLSYDRDYYWRWLHRAQEFVRTSHSLKREEDRRGIDRVACRYDQVVERLLAMPRTFIHGEFYANNLLIRNGEGSLRICPVDWEMAAVAPGIMDLAALSCGNWSDDERQELALAYRSAFEPNANGSPGPDSLLTALDLCQLHLAVQWLGWSLNWSPPPEQACNWLSEALRLIEKLGL